MGHLLAKKFLTAGTETHQDECPLPESKDGARLPATSAKLRATFLEKWLKSAKFAPPRHKQGQIFNDSYVIFDGTTAKSFCGKPTDFFEERLSFWDASL